MKYVTPMDIEKEFQEDQQVKRSTCFKRGSGVTTAAKAFVAYDPDNREYIDFYLRMGGIFNMLCSLTYSSKDYLIIEGLSNEDGEDLIRAQKKLKIRPKVLLVRQ